MKLYIVLYIVLSVIGIICNTIGECRKGYKNKKMYLNTGFIVTIIAGVILGLGFCVIDKTTSSGLYTYKVNGVKTSSGALSAPLMIILGIVIGLFTNALSTAISKAIANNINKKNGEN